MKTIILDTNFLLIPAEFRIDIFTEIHNLMDEPYEISILDMTLDELKQIQETQGGKAKSGAKLAQALIEHKKLKIIDIKQKSLNTPVNSKAVIVDDILLNISDKNTIVATQDGSLKKRLAEKGVKTIILRNKKHLVIR